MKDGDKTKEQLMNELHEMRQRTAKLEASETQKKEGEAALRKLSHDLGERVKGLDCLYGISNIVEKQGLSVEKIFQGTVHLIPPSWQYPEITCARVILEGQEFRTSNFQETIWKQTSDITTHGERIGALEVFYLEEKPERDEGPFLKEERSLINAIGERLGRIIERLRAEGELRKHRNHLEDMVKERIAELTTANEQLQKEITERVQAQEALQESEEKYRSLFEKMLNGFAYCKILLDENNHPVDFVYLEVNDSFERLTGLKKEDVVGKKASEAIPTIKDTHPELFDIYGKVALTGKQAKFDIYFEPLDIWLSISVYSPQKGYFVAVFDNITKRKQAQEGLRESEERFRTSIENMLDCFGIYSAIRDKSGRIIDFRIDYVNKAACENNLMTKEEQTGKPLCELLPAHRESGLFDEYRRLVETGKPLRKESLIYEDVYKKKHLIRAFDISASRLGDGFVAAWRDITEQKLVNEDLDRARQEWEDIFQAIGHPTLILTLDHSVISANRAALRAVGASQEAVLGKKCYEVFHKTDDPAECCPMEKMLTSGRFETIEMEMEALGGVFLVSCTPILDDTGRVAQVIHIATDISERKRAEEQIQKSKATLQAVFDGISEPLMILGEDLSVKMLNNAAMGYYGASRLEETTIKCCFNALMGKSSPCEGCGISSAVLGGQAKTFEQSSVVHPGRLEQVVTYPLQERENGVTGAIVRITDITEKRKTEEQLARADRLASLGQLSGGIAHEIRNPLASINLFVDILRDKDKFDQTDKELEILDEIKGDIGRITGIIKRILEFAKPSVTSEVEVDINALIRENLKLWSAKMRKSKIRLELFLEEGLPRIHGDAIELQQIINNLVLNAIEAMNRGGVLRISTSRGISSFHEGRKVVCINVNDTGPGIETEHAESIFNPFFTTKAAGTGLGLAITYQIIKRHGGLISFESKLDNGTTFTIELPANARD